MPTSPPPPRTRGTSWVALLTWVLFFGFIAAAVRNTLASEPHLEGLAREVACAPPVPPTSVVPSASAAPLPAASSKGAAGKPAATAVGGKPPGLPPSVKPPVVAPCRLQTTRWESNPFGRSFEFQEAGMSRPVLVQCLRQYYAVGDYRCAVLF
jgi:hypothetical protein